MTLTNRGSAPDRLIAIDTPVAEMAELHRDEMRGSVMTMRPAGPLDLAPGQTVAVQPGDSGLHVMLMHMTRALKAGDRFPLTLTFEKAGTVTAEAIVGNTRPAARCMTCRCTTCRRWGIDVCPQRGRSAMPSRRAASPRIASAASACVSQRFKRLGCSSPVASSTG